jgi:hypothetical protein
MYKLKTLWFAMQGRGNSDLLCQEREVWSLILSQKIDDVKSQGIQRALKNRVDKFTKELYSQLEITANRISQDVEKLKAEGHNKDYIETYLNGKQVGIISCSIELICVDQIIYHQIWDGANSFDTVIKEAKKCCSKSKLESVRHLANNIRFY